MRRWVLVILLALLFCRFASALDRSALLFYAPFDGSADAALARGKAAPKSAPSVKFKEGVMGQGVVPGKDIIYEAPGNMASEGTVCFWVKPLTWEHPNGSNHYLFRAPPGNYFGLYYGVLRYHHRHEGQVVPVDVWQELEKGVWHFFALTWREDLREMYIDGIRRQSRSQGVGPVRISGRSTFRLPPNERIVDELMVFNRVLTRHEIKALFYRVERKADPPEEAGEGRATALRGDDGRSVALAANGLSWSCNPALPNSFPKPFSRIPTNNSCHAFVCLPTAERCRGDNR